jgi:glyoxylate utilization-related uncharacterized protein
MKYACLVSVVGLLLVASFLISCKDDEPKFTSADGDWVYTTPDSKMTVKFSITTSSGTMVINGTKLTVDGVDADLVTIASGISSMRFSTNDAKLTVVYYIRFTDGVVSSDFTKINVPNAEYTFPYGTTNRLTSITISRQ